MKNARTWGYYYRHPRTHQEKAINSLHKIEGIKIRKKRTGYNLVDSYSDVYYSKARSKSWKDLYKKKTQWNKKHLKAHAFFPYEFEDDQEYFECPTGEKLKEMKYCYYDCPFYFPKYNVCIKNKKKFTGNKGLRLCNMLRMF